MKQFLPSILFIPLMFACTVDEDPCADTEAADIAVSFTVTAYNIDNSGTGSLYDLQSEKHPCGAEPKGQFDINGWIDSNGTFESGVVGYNLRNTEDQVIFTYWFSGIGSGTRVITYNEARAYDGGTLNIQVNFASPELQTFHEQYDDDPTDFRQCQDLAWSAVTGSPKDGGTADKAALYDRLKRNGWLDIEQGVVPEGSTTFPVLDLADGDIVMLSFDEPPGTDLNPGANHYAVVYAGKLYQILNWPQGGAFDGPRDLSFFFQPRTLVNTFTGETVVADRPYQYYKVWRKPVAP